MGKITNPILYFVGVNAWVLSFMSFKLYLFIFINHIENNIYPNIQHMK